MRNPTPGMVRSWRRDRPLEVEHDRAKGVPLNTGAILVKLRDFGPAAALLLVVPILNGIKKNALAAKADRFLPLDCSSSSELAWRPFRATISL